MKESKKSSQHRYITWLLNQCISFALAFASSIVLKRNHIFSLGAAYNAVVPLLILRLILHPILISCHHQSPGTIEIISIEVCSSSTPDLQGRDKQSPATNVTPTSQLPTATKVLALRTGGGCGSIIYSHACDEAHDDAGAGRARCDSALSRIARVHATCSVRSGTFKRFRAFKIRGSTFLRVVHGGMRLLGYIQL